jgi:ligand-binding SRPBCC domain-containing protein
MNLAKITPKELHFVVLTKVTGKDIYEGMILDYKVAPLLRLQVSWQTVIREVIPVKSFTDFQLRGPYKYWNHHHEFIANDDGILMKDTVDYELPLGFIGEIFHRLVVKKKLEAIFDYRYKVLETLFDHKKQPL